MATIRGLGMLDFIQEPFSTPQKLLENGAINSASQARDQRDQQLLSWMLSSVSIDYLNHVVGCETSCKVQNLSVGLFKVSSKAKIVHYEMELQNTKKEGSKMYDYLLKIKKLVDSLNYSDCPTSERDHITCVLFGLTPKYNVVVVTVTAKKEDFSITEVGSLLLTHEKMLEQQSGVVESFSANFADYRRMPNEGQKFFS